MTPRLITIPFSHFCEKARWALDRGGVVYEEEAHAPIFARLPIRRLGVPGFVPVLITEDGGVVADSTAILQWVDTRVKLFVDDAADLEDKLDADLGHAARVVAYSHLVRDRRLAMKMMAPVPRWERALAGLAYPLAARFQLRVYDITPEKAKAALPEVKRVFADIGRRLADGRRYLCGGVFSAADLTFAALAGIVLLPDWPGTKLPRLEEVPEAFQAIVLELRDTPAGKHALRLYADDRV